MKQNSLKAERELRGWSQSKIADLLGTTTKTVGRWERGEAVPYPHYREQLCTLFGKNAQQLCWLQDTDAETLEAQSTDAETLEAQSAEEEALKTQDLKEITADRPSLQPSSLTEPWLLLDPAIPQAQGKLNSLLGRHELVTQVKHRLIAADNLTLTALNSLPGVGKTAVATATAMDCQVQAYFSDGILWARLGPYPNVLGQLIRWGALLGVTASQVNNVKSPQAWGRSLRAAMNNRRLLLIIEDAWTAEDALALQVGGPECAHLLTTHLPQIAQAFSEQASIIIPPLEEADALALLACFVPQLVLQDPKGAQALVRTLNCLPLALNLMGNYLASLTLTGQPQSLQATLAHLHKTEERLRASRPSRPAQESLSLVETMPLSLYATIIICDQHLSQQAHAALCTLSIFASTPDSFSKEAALAMSQQSIETLDELLDAGLLESWGAERYTLHQTVADYARTQDKGLLIYQQQISSLVKDSRIHQQEPHSSDEHLFSPRPLQGLTKNYKSNVPKFRPSKRFSWLYLFIPLTTLSAILAMVALVLAFTRLPPFTTNNPRMLLASGTTYEAEGPGTTLSGSARVLRCSRCSGGKKVGDIGLQKKTMKIGTLQFNDVNEASAGDYPLTIYYTNGGIHKLLYMSINGEAAIVLNAPNTKSWNLIGKLSIIVHLYARHNTIKFFNDAGHAPDIDRIMV